MGATIEQEPPTRVERKLDHTHAAAIVDAGLDVLRKHGCERMTMDSVAARAKVTLYRRRPSKAHLVIDALARMDQLEVDLEHLPDTGSLRGDLAGLICHSHVVVERRDVSADYISTLSDQVLLPALGQSG